VSLELLFRGIGELRVVHKFLRRCVVDRSLRWYKGDFGFAAHGLGIDTGAKDEDRGRIVGKGVNDDAGGLAGHDISADGAAVSVRLLRVDGFGTGNEGSDAGNVWFVMEIECNAGLGVVDFQVDLILAAKSWHQRCRRRWKENEVYIGSTRVEHGGVGLERYESEKWQ
jgi:hypothetical protein